MALSESVIASYKNNGWAVLKDFISLEDLHPFFRQINSLLHLSLGEPIHQVQDARVDIEKLLFLAKKDRAQLGAVYRSCRHIEALQKLLVNEKFLSVSKQLMSTEQINVCPYTATRIDLQGEEKYLFDWHQDYHYIQGSIDGVVFWMPLSPLDTTGAVEVLQGSHKLGLQKVKIVDLDNSNKNGAKTMELIPDKSIFELEKVAPKLELGDALVFSTLLVHRSIAQTATPVRVTTQFRYGNFLNPDSIKRGWPVGQLEGRSFDLDHAEFVVS